ncbi:hypothetical protein [Actinocorallia longicatena]|uniref:Secreted protein n=1 Tax=Actinocorallia longicatena TaxID=111803 RepID=A0ABP6QH55_9ACTN
MLRRTVLTSLTAAITGAVLVGTGSPAEAAVSLVNTQHAPVPSVTPYGIVEVIQDVAILNAGGLTVPPLVVGLPPLLPASRLTWTAPPGLLLDGVTCPPGAGFSGPVATSATSAYCTGGQLLAAWPASNRAMIRVPGGTAAGAYSGKVTLSGVGLLIGLPLGASTGTFTVNVI